MHRSICLKSGASLFPGWPLTKLPSPQQRLHVPKTCFSISPKYRFIPFVAKLTLNRFLSTVYIGPQGLIFLLQLCCTWVKEKVHICGLTTVGAFFSCHKCTYVFFLYSSNLRSCRGFLYRSNKCLLMRQMAVCFLLAGTFVPVAPQEDKWVWVVLLAPLSIRQPGPL